MCNLIHWWRFRRQFVWVRVRTIDLKGVMGVWNDPAQIRTARCEGGAWCLVWGEPLARPGATEPVAPREQLTTHNLQLPPPLSASSFCFRVGWEARRGQGHEETWIGLNWAD